MVPLLSATNLSKQFGTLPVLRNISLDIAAGQVIGLVGQSGAGKSVLAMVLNGVYGPDGGQVLFEGRSLRWPFCAQKLGIEIIHQQPYVVENLDITSNVFLGREINIPLLRRRLAFISPRQMDEKASAILSEFEFRPPSLREKAANLSAEQRQIVSIARALVQPARLFIIDEPTYLLSHSHQKTLTALIQRWKEQGAAVIFCEKNLDLIFASSDRIVALYQGMKVLDRPTDDVSREEVVAAILGASDHQHLTPAIWALDSYYRAREQAERLVQQQRSLEYNLASRDALNRQLVAQLGEQVRMLDQVNLALQDAHRRLLTQREEERKHFARELHDGAIQDLLSVGYRLEALENRWHTEHEAKAELEDIRHAVRDLVEDLRFICTRLRPPTIDSLGLVSALKSLAHDWTDRTGIAVALELDNDLGRLPESIELSVFRIVQEALSNVHKHAHASRVHVALTHTSPRTLLVVISDNGQGLGPGFDFSALSADGHYGLLGISERVALLGGRVKLERPPPGGLRLTVEIPHPRAEAPVLRPENDRGHDGGISADGIMGSASSRF